MWIQKITPLHEDRWDYTTSLEERRQSAEAIIALAYEVKCAARKLYEGGQDYGR